MPPWSPGYPAGERTQEKGISGDTRWQERLWEGGGVLTEFHTECKWHGWGSQHCTEQKNPQAGEIVCYLSCNVLVSVGLSLCVCVCFIQQQKTETQDTSTWPQGKQEGCLWVLTFKMSQPVLPQMPCNHIPGSGRVVSARPLWVACVSSQHTLLVSPWALHLFYTLLVLTRSHWR